MSTTISILEHLWGSPQLQESFTQVEADNGNPFPSFHSMFYDLTHVMSHRHVNWFEVTVDPYPVFRWVMHTTEEWDQILAAMGQDIVDDLFKRATS